MSIFMTILELHIVVFKFSKQRHILVSSMISYKLVTSLAILLASAIFFSAVCHHFDTIVYPKNFTSKQKEGGMRWPLWSRSDTQEDKGGEFKPLTLPEMCEKCFYYYLSEYGNMLSKCNFPQSFSFAAFIDEIGFVYSSLRCPQAIKEAWSWGWGSPINKIQKNLQQVSLFHPTNMLFIFYCSLCYNYRG